MEDLLAHGFRRLAASFEFLDAPTALVLHNFVEPGRKCRPVLELADLVEYHQQHILRRLLRLRPIPQQTGADIRDHRLETPDQFPIARQLLRQLRLASPHQLVIRQRGQFGRKWLALDNGHGFRTSTMARPPRSRQRRLNPGSEVQCQTVGAMLWCTRVGGPEVGCIQRCCPKDRKSLCAK